MTMSVRKKSGDRTIPASEFKARCLELIDQVSQDRREIVVTKRGRPTAKLVPFEEKPRGLWGYLEGTVTYRGDIVSPTGEIWEADAD
jgi:prevent-host-death family protein